MEDIMEANGRKEPSGRKQKVISYERGGLAY